MSSNNSRRSFLIKGSLAACSFGIIPSLIEAKPDDSELNIKNSKCNHTTEDYYGQGPFYTPNAPKIKNSKLASSFESGTPLVLSGTVYSNDCSSPIANAVLDIWHADNKGKYDNSGYKLRGKTTTDEHGNYSIKTIKPGFYSTGKNFRPSHIHIKITPPNGETLTTQLYFKDDPYISIDPAASIKTGKNNALERTIELTENDGVLTGKWDAVMDFESPTKNDVELKAEKGMIYKVDPNPFSNTFNIEYGVFQNSDVKLELMNCEGDNVLEIVNEKKPSGKYITSYEAPSTLATGNYFLIMKVNNLQVHCLRVEKK